MQPWGKVLAPSQGIHRTTSLSSSTVLNPHKWKMLTTWWSILRFREGHNLIILRTREAHLETTRGQRKAVKALHTSQPLSAPLPLNHCYGTSHEIRGLGHRVFEGTSPPCAPLPGKAIKLFFSPKILSLRSNSAPGYRCQSFIIPPYSFLIRTDINQRGGGRKFLMLCFLAVFVWFANCSLNFGNFQ